MDRGVSLGQNSKISSNNAHSPTTAERSSLKYCGQIGSEVSQVGYVLAGSIGGDANASSSFVTIQSEVRLP